MQQLIFVYNADSGLLNLGKDIVHKLLSPATYPCKLCDLTYGVIGEKPEWAAFRKRLRLEQSYLHKDEFVERFGQPAHELPIIYLEDNGQLAVLMSAEEMNRIQSLDAFIAGLETKIQNSLLSTA